VDSSPRALQRADEVRALDAQLRVKVRDRSRELARALRDVSATDARSRPAAGSSALRDRHPIGSGAWGEVYAGADLASGQRVAVKISAAPRPGPGRTRTLRRRGGGGRGVVHPRSCARSTWTSHETGLLYLVMELVQGRTLAAELAAGTFDGRRPPGRRGGGRGARGPHGGRRRSPRREARQPDAHHGARRACACSTSDLSWRTASTSPRQSPARWWGPRSNMAPEQIRGDGRVTGACDMYEWGRCSTRC